MKVTCQPLIHRICLVVYSLIIGAEVDILDVPDTHLKEHPEVHESDRYRQEFVPILMVSLSHHIAREDKKQEKLGCQLVELEFVQIGDLFIALLILDHLKLWIQLH